MGAMVMVGVVRGAATVAAEALRMAVAAKGAVVRARAALAVVALEAV